MNEILSNNLSENWLRKKGTVFMRHIIKILFCESVDVTAQYRYKHRLFHQYAILGYVY